MSFLSIVGNALGKIVGVERAVAPFVSFIPGAAPVIHGFDLIASTVLSSMGKAEVGNPIGGGQIKADSVVADFEAGLEITKAVAEADGKQVVYDEATLRSALMDLTNGFNKLALVKASIKIIPKT